MGHARARGGAGLLVPAAGPRGGAVAHHRLRGGRGGRGLKRFAQLLELLVLTPSRNRKIEALREYFATVPDPDRGFALAILTGALTFKNVKPAILRDTVIREVDPYLFH